MKIFISWSGERSEALARGLRDWLPLVLHYADPWLSKSDIQAGERWSVEIAKELESSNFGIICVTPENINSAWTLFEAGALAKSMQDGRVIPMLLDLDFKNISGPLAQFQAKKVDLSGIRDMVVDLNKAAAAPIGESQLNKLFEALWTDFEKQIGSLPKISLPSKNTRSQGEILEDLVTSIRNVEMRVRDTADDEPRARKRRRTSFPPEMLGDFTARIGIGPNDPIRILIFASQFREDIPWLYELALDLYKTLRSGNRKEWPVAKRRFVEAVELISHGPFGDMISADRQYFYYTLREIITPFLREMVPGSEAVNISPRSKRVEDESK